MKRLALLAIVLAACSEQTVNTDTMDTRAPISIFYVGAPELPVREKPDDAAPVIATYQNGESISVLAEQGDWVEVRTGETSGWARKADLTTAEAKTAQEENPQPKFRLMPLPITAPNASGEIYIEADVNTDGDVVNTRIITNTTNSPMLAQQNADALRNAKLYPIVQKGERVPFKYYHRVTY
jgi:uncharacterized protein YgiM (DUF1202 family)